MTTYNPDGTWVDLYHGSRLNASSRGTYKVQGNQIVKTIDVFTVNGKPMPEDGKPFTVTVRWISNDNIETVTPEDGRQDKTTYTRRKS